MQIPAFANGAYASQSPNADCEVCINLYPEAMESPGAKAAAVLYPCPGFIQRFTLSPGPIRGMYSNAGRTFAVSGFNLYELFSDYTSILRDTVAVNDNPAVFTSNGSAGGQLGITSGDHFYCYDLNANTLTEVLSSGATTCDFLDGYGLVLDAATSTLRVSDLEDMSNFDPTQVAQRSQGADPWISMKVIQSNIWLMGEQTAEAWSNVGTFPFPFAPVPQGFIQQGTRSAFSLASLNNTLVWLQHNAQGAGMVMRLNGYDPQRISTHAIEFAIQGYAQVEDAIGFTYQQQGHDFYVLNFPHAAATWVYDLNTNLWHARGYWNPLTASFECYRIQSHCHTTQNVHFVGDRITGAVYEMSIETALEVDGTGIRRVRQFRGLNENELRIFYSNAQLVLQSGVGLVTGQGTNPQVMLTWSNDGGHAFSSEIWASAGRLGDYGARVMWRGSNGSARNRVYQVAMTDPVPWRLINFLTDAEVGIS